MAKLYFYYATMNSGKSTHLLQAAFNYRERGMNVAIYTAALDDRYGAGKVTSRIGIHAPASLFDAQTDLFSEIASQHQQTPLACVLVDEAQFLTREQVLALTDVVDKLGIPVLCYGLRTDFQMALFEGSRYLLAWADCLEEIKSVCECGRKANFVLRLDANGKPVKEGAQIQIGGEELYLSVCRQHYKARLAETA